MPDTSPSAAIEAAVAQAAGEHIGAADILRHAHGPLGPGHRLLEASLDGVLAAQSAVAQRQRMAGPERLQDLQRAKRLGARCGGIGHHRAHARRDQECPTQLQWHGPRRLPDLHRAVGVVGCFAEAVERVQRPGGDPVQAGDLEGAQPRAVLQRQPGEGGGLAMAAGLRGVAGRRGRVAGYRWHVAGPDRVVYQPRRLGTRSSQGLENPAVADDPARRGQPGLDDAACQLVAEPEAVAFGDDHPSLLGGSQGGGVVQHGRHQPPLSLGRDHRELLKGRLAGGR
jgi:hypothetical protein